MANIAAPGFNVACYVTTGHITTARRYGASNIATAHITGSGADIASDILGDDRSGMAFQILDISVDRDVNLSSEIALLENAINHHLAITDRDTVALIRLAVDDGAATTHANLHSKILYFM